jgi:hypothetical protein
MEKLSVVRNPLCVFTVRTVVGIAKLSCNKLLSSQKRVVYKKRRKSTTYNLTNDVKYLENEITTDNSHER